MTGVIIACAVLLATAVPLILRRAEAGPSVLDRVVALDVLVSTILAGFVLYSAWTGRNDFLAVMVVLALVGFVGAVTLARFVAAESEEEGRILTPEEVAELEQRESAAIEALARGGAAIEPDLGGLTPAHTPSLRDDDVRDDVRDDGVRDVDVPDVDARHDDARHDDVRGGDVRGGDPRGPRPRSDGPRAADQDGDGGATGGRGRGPAGNEPGDER